MLGTSCIVERACLFSKHTDRTLSNQQTTDNRQQTTDNRQQTIDNRQQTTDDILKTKRYTVHLIMPKDFSFLEEASKVVVGKTNNFRIQWNSVSLGDNDVIVERPAMSLDQIHSRKSK